jgi:RNA polymerase sigma factor (TIGR02999 family)
MAHERRGHTLQATALVHEVWAKLAASDAARWASPKAFASLAAEAMRRVLIDHARGRAAKKRGGGAAATGDEAAAQAKRAMLSIDDVIDLAEAPDPEAIVRFDSVLQRLEAVDDRAAEVVRLRFYAGLSAEETAEALGTSLSSVKRDWQFARAWLLREVGR